VKPFVRKIGRWLAASSGFVFVSLCYLYLTVPDVRPLRTANPETTAFIELRAREARAKGQTPRRVQRWVSYRKISPDLTRAVLVAEDDAFWQHEGLDVVQLEKSLEADWAKGAFVRGGSTVTQQLAKNLYLSPSKNPLRKLKELIIARRLEAELSKSRILELYLNVIEWGDGIYGAEAAARTYFHTGVDSLGPSESAMLAGAIINPRVLSPARPTARLLRRQEMILRRMGSVTPPVAAETVPPPVETVDSDAAAPSPDASQESESNSDISEAPTGPPTDEPATESAEPVTDPDSAPPAE
jgi:monofunctional biosynthetic peptidoglycan transglycosylase